MVEITVFWRPGCVFCTGLLGQLDRLEVPYERVNIWEDPEGAALVREANRGSETVPTVRIGAEMLVNPAAADVLAAAHRVDPETSLPAPPQPGRLRRTLWRMLGVDTSR